MSDQNRFLERRPTTCQLTPVFHFLASALSFFAPSTLGEHPTDPNATGSLSFAFPQTRDFNLLESVLCACESTTQIRAAYRKKRIIDVFCHYSLMTCLFL